MKIFLANTCKIGTSTECGWRARQHQCTNAALLGVFLNLSKFDQRLQVNGIALLGAVERNDGRQVRPLNLDCVYHGFEVMTSSPQPIDPTSLDPVRQRRKRIALWTSVASRLGYSCFGASIVAVAVGLLGSFTPLVGRIATGGLIVGSILLAPAIVLGYAIKAAEKEDRINGV